MMEVYFELDDLHFADDIAIVSFTKQQTQDKTRLDEEARRVGLKNNIEKTKVLRINARNQEKMTINGQDVEGVEELLYLGDNVCEERGGVKDLKNRLSKARGAFIRLIRTWNFNSISRKTKLRLYKTLVVPVLVYEFKRQTIN